MANRRCAESPINAEFSLCGIAFDAYHEDADAAYDVASPTDSITCPRCCQIISTVKAMRNRLRPRKGDDGYSVEC